MTSSTNYLLHRNLKPAKLLLLLAITVIAVLVSGQAGSRPVFAAADAITFSPTAASLLPGESVSVTISVTNMLTADNLTGVQVNIGSVPGEFSFSGLSCIGDFAGGFAVPPAEKANGTVFGCTTPIGAKAIGDGVTEPAATINITRNSGTVGDRTLTFTTADAGFETQLGNPGAVTITDLTSTLTITGYSAPGPVTGLTATSPRGRQMDLSWTAPGAATPVVTGYRIVRNDNAAFADVGVVTSVSLYGVDTAAQTYSVFALNGATSTVVTSAATAAPATAPGAPTGVTIVSEGNGQVNVSWTAPVFLGTWTATTSVATTQPTTSTGTLTGNNVGSVGGPSSLAPGGSTTATVSSLTNGTPATFQVSAVTGVGTGASSTASSAGIPFGTPAAPTNVNGQGISQGVRVTLAAPTSTGGVAIGAYRVDILSSTSTKSVASGTVLAAAFVTVGTSTQIDFTDSAKVINGTSYDVQVSTVNVGGNVSAGATSTPSATSSLTAFTAVGRPGPVTAVNVAAGNGSVTASWAKVTTDASGNALVTAVNKYTVSVTPADVSPILITDVTKLAAATQSIVISGLTNGTAYTVTVVASNPDGNSDPKTSSSVTPESTALSSVTLGLSSFTISANGTHRFTATPLTGSGGTPANVTIVFSVTGGGTIDASSGLYTAPNAGGTSVVTASATQSGTGATASDSVTVTVLAPPPAATPTPEPVNPPGPVPTPPPPDNVGGGTSVVTPVEGGTVATEDGGVKLEIKPGTVDAFVVVDVSPVQVASVPAVPTALRVRVSTGGVVDITFKDADGKPIDNFVAGRAITVTVKFTDAEAADAGGANNLVIMKYDEKAGTWSKLTTTVDLLNKTLSAQVKTFSLFGVGIPEVVAAPTATAAAGATATPRPDVSLPATGDVAPGAGAIMGFIVLGLIFLTSGVAIVRRRQVVRSRI